MVTTDLDSVARLVAAHAQRAEDEGRLSREVVEAVREAGFARHFVPEAWQGEQGTFLACARAVADIGEIDASASWCASIAASMGRMAAYLPAEGQQVLWARGPDAFVCGTLQPSGTAAPSPGGWTLSGRWPFVTGVHFSDWALLTCRTQGDGGELRAFLVPRSAYSIEETWRSPGMCATGSDTLVMSGALVPQGCTFIRQTLLDGSPSAADGAVYAVAHEAVSGLAFAAPLLGAARGALAEWTRSARHKMMTSRTADQQGILALARSSGEIDAAGLLLNQAASLLDQAPLTEQEAASARRDYPVTADLLVRAVNRLFRSAGSRGVTKGGAFERHWRDVNAASVHPALTHGQAAEAYAASVLSQHPVIDASARSAPPGRLATSPSACEPKSAPSSTASSATSPPSFRPPATSPPPPSASGYPNTAAGPCSASTPPPADASPQRSP